MAALGEPPQGCGGTAGPRDPDRSLFLTVRTPRQAWLGKNPSVNSGFQAVGQCEIAENENNKI